MIGKLRRQNDRARYEEFDLVHGAPVVDHRGRTWIAFAVGFHHDVLTWIRCVGVVPYEEFVRDMTPDECEHGLLDAELSR